MKCGKSADHAHSPVYRLLPSLPLPNCLLDGQKKKRAKVKEEVGR